MSRIFSRMMLQLVLSIKIRITIDSYNHFIEPYTELSLTQIYIHFSLLLYFLAKKYNPEIVYNTNILSYAFIGNQGRNIILQCSNWFSLWNKFGSNGNGWGNKRVMSVNFGSKAKALLAQSVVEQFRRSYVHSSITV